MLEPLPPLQQSIIPCNSTIIVGLSGGPDSIYLLHQIFACKEKLNIKIIAVHLNHEWQESAKIAQQLSQDICDSFGVHLIVKKLSELKFEVKWNGSQEELGRNMRRYVFESVAQEYQAAAIALAHHVQDQQETFFIRLVRGSSLTGLTGMKEKEGLYIRPILHCSKKDIMDYLENHKIAYYTDPTNASDDYLRNRIRNHVIPALQFADKRFDQKIISTMHQLAQVDNFLQQQVEQTLAKISCDQGIDIHQFLSLHTILQQNILLFLMIEQQVTFAPSQKLFKEIMRFLEKSMNKQHIIHNSWMIQKNKSHFMIKKLEIVKPAYASLRKRGGSGH
ncbi:MAG: tRNA lysidine(34) synthetase TilS [Candidatus Dependentiae bacterium]|nr:tRNA lysidine(34) synthetase TilS [Candidatus Dependentiae bacterium]